MVGPTNMLCSCLHGHAYTQHDGPPSRDAGFQERTRLHGHRSTRTHSMMGRPRATQGKHARRAPADKPATLYPLGVRQPHAPLSPDSPPRAASHTRPSPDSSTRVLRRGGARGGGCSEADTRALAEPVNWSLPLSPLWPPKMRQNTVCIGCYLVYNGRLSTQHTHLEAHPKSTAGGAG